MVTGHASILRNTVLHCILNDKSPIIPTEWYMGDLAMDADTRNAGLAEQVGFKGHVKILLTVRFIINS